MSICVYTLSMGLFGLSISVKRTAKGDTDLSPITLSELSGVVSELSKVVQRLERKVYRDEAKVEVEGNGLPAEPAALPPYPGMPTSEIKL